MLLTRSFRRTHAQIIQTAKLNVLPPTCFGCYDQASRGQPPITKLAEEITGLEHPTQSEPAISALHLLGILSMVLGSI